MNNKNLVEIGSKKFHTPIFLLSDIENIHIKKNEIDFARKNGDEKRANELYHDFLNTLYPNIPIQYREYVFIYNIVASEGKSTYKLQYKCEHCEKVITSLLTIGLNYKEVTYKFYKNFELVFDYINEEQPSVDMILDNIIGLRIGDNFFEWNSLSKVTQETIFSYIPHEDYEKILKDMMMCRAHIKGHDTKCCDKGVDIRGSYDVYGGMNIFDILINSKNLTTFYQLNHQLLTRGISLEDQKKMKPFERDIYISMIIKQEKEEREQYEKNGVSRR